MVRLPSYSCCTVAYNGAPLSMKLFLPIKEGRPFGSIRWQRKIKSLDDFKSKFLSQRFGDNKNSIYKEWGLKGHTGLDMPYNDRTPVYASHDGIVTFTGLDSAGGIGVDLWNKAGKFKTRYWHLRAYKPNVDDELKAGDLIGWGDSTGFSTGHHLHFALKLTDNKGNTINKDNGYRGAIDPLPYLVWFEDMKLTKEDVEKIYATWDLVDPEGVKYWTDKGLDPLLDARIRDKIKQLEKYN